MMPERFKKYVALLIQEEQQTVTSYLEKDSQQQKSKQREREEEIERKVTLATYKQAKRSTNMMERQTRKQRHFQTKK